MFADEIYTRLMCFLACGNAYKFHNVVVFFSNQKLFSIYEYSNCI